MTKAELLEDLKNRSFIRDLNAEPTFREEKQDGTRWYTINAAETFGTAAVYKNIDFYVFDEGTADEAAYYKDRDPQRDVSTSGFRNKLSQHLHNDHDDIFGWVYRHTDEYYGMAVLEAVVPNPDGSDTLIPQLFIAWLSEDSEGNEVAEKKLIDISADLVAQTTILKG